MLVPGKDYLNPETFLIVDDMIEVEDQRKLKEFLNKFLAPYKLSSFNTSLYKASKSFPLQKILKNSSLALFTFLKKLYLSTIIIQESIEAIKRINITILTTIPASKIRFNTEISSITLS